MQKRMPDIKDKTKKKRIQRKQKGEEKSLQIFV